MRWRPGVGSGGLRALLLALPAAGVPGQSPAAGLPVAQTCGPAVSPDLVAPPLPAAVTGRVAYFAAEYDPSTLRVRRSLGRGTLNELHPLASAYKPLVVEAALRDVDAGRLHLNTALTTTAASRSIEDYPPGTNSLATLARRAIVQSDNTAADLLQQAVGTQRFARSIRERSSCTTILLTGKAAWAAQGFLLSGVLGDDLLAGALRYAALPFEPRLAVATRLNAAAAAFSGPEVEGAIDSYFRGLLYDPRIDLAFQHTGTARAQADLVARVYGGKNLRPATRRLLRQWLGQGCCRPERPRLTPAYWGAKAGSGWGVLTLSGLLETADGRLFAYAYLNDASASLDSQDMEAQIPAVVTWIEQGLVALARP